MPIEKHVNTPRRKAQNRASDERRGSARDRGYSREWDKFAAAWLKWHPLCAYCIQQGRVTPSELVDHIVPHKGVAGRFWPQDGADYNLHFAACCRACHDGPKQRAERSADRTGRDVRAVLHGWGMLPDGFPGTDPDYPIKSAGAVIICGPPAAGKSTLAREMQKGSGGRIYDLDDIAEEMGLPRFGRTHDQAVRAIQERDIRLLGHSPSARLILIVSAPTASERSYWSQRLNADCKQLVVARDVCVKRAKKRSKKNADFQAQVEAIDYWFAQTDL